MMWTSPALALCLLNLCPKKKRKKHHLYSIGVYTIFVFHWAWFLEIFGCNGTFACFPKAQHHFTFVLRHLAHHYSETHLGIGSDPLRHLEDDSNLGQKKPAKLALLGSETRLLQWDPWWFQRESERGCILWAFFSGYRVVPLGIGTVQAFLFENPLLRKREAERDWNIIHTKSRILQVMPEIRSCMIMSHRQFFWHPFFKMLGRQSGHVVAGQGILVLCHSTTFGRSLASGCVWFMVDDSCHLHRDLWRLGWARLDESRNPRYSACATAVPQRRCCIFRLEFL